MCLSIIERKNIAKTSNSSHIVFTIAIFALASSWPAIGEEQNLIGQLNEGVGLACEKEGNTNRKVYRSFFKFSKDRKMVATVDYRNDQPTLTAHHETTVLPEFIEWENFQLNRKTLILTNLTISPRKQECVVVTFEDLIERAKAHLIELQKGNKI